MGSMIVVVCSAIIKKGESFLVVKEFKPNAAGKWGLPGGKLEEGESIRESVRREVQEETGFTVTAEKLIAVINKPKTHEGNTVIRFMFQCEVTERPVSTAEHEHKFMPITKLESLDAQGLIRGQEVIPLLKQVAAGLSVNIDTFLQIL